MGWGIAETAPENEKIKARFNDYIKGLNSCCHIDYPTYSDLYDEGFKLLDEMYELGKKEGAEKSDDKT
jgi:hypothetical protein